MDIVTYAAVNGITIEDAKVVLEALFAPKTQQDLRRSVLYGAGYRGTHPGRPNRVGSARSVPLAYTH